MKKIFYILASAIVALGAVACDNQDLDNIAPGAKGEGLTITATIDEATKVAFEGMQAKSWEEGDFITVGDFKFDYVPAEDVFRCTDEGVFGLADGTTKYTAYANKLNSAAGIKGSTFVSTEAKLIDQNVSFVFKLNSALLKYTTTEEVTFEGTALSESFTVTGNGTTQYIAVKAGEEVTISYSINGVQCKSTSETFVAGKVYNLGTLEAPLAGTGEGTLESPYDVVRAKAAIDAYTTVSNVYVKGIVTATATKYNSTYKSCDYYISVDGTTDNELMVYSGKFVDGADFTSADQIHAGDEVVVCGNLKKYNSTYEFDKTSKIVSLVCNHEEEPDQPVDPDQPANAIALPWMESFDSEDLSKYTIVNGGSDTKVYPNDKLAGGEAGEILIGKNTGSMTANIATDGSAQTLNLWFKSNYADRVTVTSATTGVTLTKVTNTGYTVEVAAGVEVFALTLSNTNSSNVRVDDIVLTAEEPTIESISVSGAQVLFTEGDDFATGDDFTVTAILQNGATKDVTANVTVDSSAVDMTTAGTYTVTVSYDNISTTYNVTVQAAGVEIVTTSFVFKEMGYSNAEDVASVTQDGVTIDFALGTNTNNNSAKYYNTGEGVRTYVGNTITVSCDGDISAIDFKFAGDSYNKISADGYSGTTWSGSAKEVVFDSTGTTRIQSITVTYAK